MKLEFISMATLVHEDSGVPYLCIAFNDEQGNYCTWEMSLEDALTNHFDMAFCVQGLRDITAKQKRAHETSYGDLQYAESRSFKGEHYNG